MAIDPGFLQELHNKLDIETVVGGYVSLKRRGKNLVGLCPFHNEKTGSFTVYPESNSFYCFGCGAAGDVITFIRKIENLDYVEAVKSAADMVGMVMPEKGYDDTLEKARRRMLAANREAAKFFHTCLMKPENRHALEYFLKRGLSMQTITHFGLGYAPDDWHALTNHLRGLGFNEQEIINANLARRPSGEGKTGCYDNFRNRVMFPIINVRGDVIAFGGRVLQSDVKGMKYLNTSDTLVFKKGNGVFGLNFAKNSGERKLILVEGYMDVIALHQAGFTNAIAGLGTAFTKEMAGLLARYADEVLICYDNDEAGRKATQRILPILGQTGLKLKVVKMEGGKDADEIIRTNGKERFQSILNGAANMTEYKLTEEMGKFNITTDDGRSKFLASAAKILAACTPVECDVYTLRLSEQFGISKDALASQVRIEASRLKRQRAEEKAKEETKMLFDTFTDSNNPEREKNLRAARAEETLISSLMRNPDFYKKLRDCFSPDDFITVFNKKIIRHLVYLIENGYSTELSMFDSEFDTDEMKSVGRIAMISTQLGNTLSECYDCIKVIKEVAENSTSDPLALSDEDYLKAFAKKNKN